MIDETVSIEGSRAEGASKFVARLRFTCGDGSSLTLSMVFGPAALCFGED